MSLKMSSDDAKKTAPPVSGGMRQILDHNSKLRVQLREAEAERVKQVTEMEEKIAVIEQAHQEELVRVKESMHELNTVQQQLTASQAEVERLEGEKCELQEKLSDSVAETAASKKEIAAQKQSTAEVRKELDKTKSELSKATEEIELLQAQVEKMKPATVENAKLQGRIAVLQRDLQAEVEAKEAQIAECEALRQEGTLQRCQELEAENASMKALVKQRDEETAAAQKAQEEAEKIAFESRSRLLSLYADEEAKDILKDSLDKANEEVKRQAKDIERLKQEVLEGEQRLEDMEYKILHSSKRDNLRDSLSALAKKRKIDDSNG
jgi:DNA repair exonuclease SbcCD ATPase subunit